MTQSFIKWCVDGRTRAGGVREADPNAAGGTLTLVYSRLLLPGQKTYKTDLEATEDIADDLVEQALPMGVHGGPHSDCDCGACAKARLIIGLIGNNGDSLRQISADHGVTVDDQVHETITTSAKEKAEATSFFVEDRPAVVKAIVDRGGEYEHLEGDHMELAAAVNTIPNTTIDRAAIRAKYGENYDVFVVDAWAIGDSVDAINETGSKQEADGLAAAAVYYNFATAGQLGGPSLAILPVAA